MLKPLDSEESRLRYDDSLTSLSRPEDEIVNCNMYHGVRSKDTALDILDSGSIKSPQRQSDRPNDMDAFRNQQVAFIEDVIRLCEGVPDTDVHLIEFAEENEEFIREYASEDTTNFIDNYLGVFEHTGRNYLCDQGVYGPLRDFCVSVGDDIESHVHSRVSDKGVAFEISLPVDATINPGTPIGNVPGEIPLDYVTQIYHGRKLNEESVHEIESHENFERHGFEISSVSEY